MRWLASLTVVALAVLSLAPSTRAETFEPRNNKIIIIEPGRERGSSNEAELRNRIYRLELAVQQLQDKVFELSRNQAVNQNNPFRPIGTIQPPALTTCYITTTFKGTFTETAPTETAAKAGVLKKCGDGDGGLDCRERNVKCGR